MSVRKTESRIPANFQAADLGHAVPGADGRCTLVAFMSSPIVRGRDNTYVVFVTDAGLAGQVQNYEWVISENGTETKRETTSVAEYTYRPGAVGQLSLTVNLQGGGTLASLSLDQTIVEKNTQLETMIAAADNETGPGIANPEVARELVNDYNTYYRSVQPTAPESGNGFFKILFDQVYDGALQRSPEHRGSHLANLTAILNSTDPNLDALAAAATGVCGIRQVLLAMSLPRTAGGADTYLPWTELPEVPADRVVPLQNLQQAFHALSHNDKVDLFNLCRFPKSNIAVCGKIIETLRNRSFLGTSFSDVLTGFNGVRLEAIVKHYREGPIHRP